jgi:hypothetical protein
MQREFAHYRDSEQAARERAEAALIAERDARQQEAKTRDRLQSFLGQMMRPAAPNGPPLVDFVPSSNSIPPISQPSLSTPPRTSPGPSANPVTAPSSSNALPTPLGPVGSGPLPSPQPIGPGAHATLSVYPVEDLAADEKQAESVVRIIQAMVEPKTWQNVGGDGVIEYFAAKKVLIVRQSPNVHRQLTELLELLRAKPASGSPRK